MKAWVNPQLSEEWEADDWLMISRLISRKNVQFMMKGGNLFKALVHFIRYNIEFFGSRADKFIQVEE